jgi:Ca-activated chloride channel family protein
MTIFTASLPPMFLASWMPVELEYLSWGQAGLLFGLIAAIVLGLGIVALTGTTPARRWVTLGLRLMVVFVLVLIIGGARWKHSSKDLEVMVLRDVSPSVLNVDGNIQGTIGNYIAAAGNAKDRPVDDRYGEIRFDQAALISSLPAANPYMAGGPIRKDGTGTDIAGAIQLGLATFDHDSMRRLVLISDGNPTMGDTDAAVAAAAAQHVPIDVVPLKYQIDHEVSMEKFVAPTWKREHDSFTLSVVLKNTNETPVTGTLTVTDANRPMNLDLTKPGDHPTLKVTLDPGSTDHPSLTRVPIKVPPLAPGVHQFHAQFNPDDSGDASKVDTMTDNNGGDAFTFVQGKGRILYVDDSVKHNGDTLLGALQANGINIDSSDHIPSSQFPPSLIELQNYDAIILSNVACGEGGLNETQQQNLATYVHDMGGGLVVIGGPNTYGAGGWRGTKLADVLPVEMDIPAKRTIPKGALVLAMDPAEAADGVGLGRKCALAAAAALSPQDDIGIISYGGHAGYMWDLPLGPKGDGSAVDAATGNWYLGDLPSFEDAITLALYGDGTSKGLIADDARSKHIIVITDDDPQMPSDGLIEVCKANHITVSTITVYPHIPHHVADGTIRLADRTGGKHFGPIDGDTSEIPQIFIKEATVVRRSLITENEKGIPLTLRPGPSETVKGIRDRLPPVRGMVLTGRKASPLVQYPITAGAESDPLLATWQTGLGKVVCYMSDAGGQWGYFWLQSPEYTKLWTQIVKSVARPPMSNRFEVNVTSDGAKGHIVVEGRDKDDTFLNFSNLGGMVMGPNGTRVNEHLVQTGPGRYEGDFDMPDKGEYVAVMQYSDTSGETGFLPVGGASQNSSPEMRDLRSNDELLEDIAKRTHGRVLTAFDAEAPGMGFYDRKNLEPAESSLPVWDRLIPLLLALILLDVAARRIAWDWVAVKRYAATSAGYVRSFTTVKHVETRGTMDALTRVRTEATTAKSTAKTAGKPGVATPPPIIAARPDARPDPRAKFEAKGVEGDIGNLVGGATDKPIPAAPKSIQPKGAAPGSSMGSLMEAKRRAQQRIKEKEQGGQ